MAQRSTLDEWYISSITEYSFLSDSSKKTYLSSIKRLQLFFKDVKIHVILTNPNKYGTILQTKIPSDHGQKNMFILMLTLFKCSGLKETDIESYKEWVEFYNKPMEKIQAQVNSHTPTDRQLESYVEWSEIIKTRKKLSPGTKEHVLLSIYTMIEPRRQLDYAYMRLYQSESDAPEEDHNFIHLCYKNNNKKPYLLIKKHKTDKFYPTFIHRDLPVRLIDTIQKSLIINPREYLFTKTDKSPFPDANSFQRYSNTMLKKIFKNPWFSVNSLRHSYATYINNLPNITLIERQQVAERMGHSIKQSMQYVFINSKTNRKKGAML